MIETVGKWGNGPRWGVCPRCGDDNTYRLKRPRGPFACGCCGFMSAIVHQGNKLRVVAARPGRAVRSRKKTAARKRRKPWPAGREKRRRQLRQKRKDK